jgi:hypothetical protein
MFRLLLIVTSATLSTSLALILETNREVKPVFVWTGADSEIEKETFVRCASQTDWEQLWQKHRGVDQWGTPLKQPMDDKQEQGHRQFCPKVDFDSYMIVAVFCGKLGDFGMYVDSVLDEPQFLRVRYGVVTAQRMPRGPRLEKPVHGYMFVVIPRTQKAIVIEEGTRQVKDHPLDWKERIKLAAIDE